MGSNNFVADLPPECSSIFNDNHEFSSSPAPIKQFPDRETLKYGDYFHQFSASNTSDEVFFSVHLLMLSMAVAFL